MFPHHLVVLCSLTLFVLRIPAQKSNGQRWLIGDRDSHCSHPCTKTQSKPVCGSDGRSYDTICDLQRAKCKDRTLTLAHRGRCKGKIYGRIDQSFIHTAPTLVSEGKELEIKDSGQSKCFVERSQALEQAKFPPESIFIPECNEDGTFAQVQCHTLTGYCWCVTTDGKPISGSSVQNKTPVCSGSVTDKPPGPPSSGRKDDGSKPTPTMETYIVPDGEEIIAPTLREKQLPTNKQNISSSRKPEKVPSCDQERQSALEEARQNPKEDIFVPDCGPHGLFKPVQCHQSTGYCWCVQVETGRPIPGTSTRYKKPECVFPSSVSDMEDPFRDRELNGCPDGQKVEFITGLLDALTTDMINTINSPTPSGGVRFAEPDPSHTLEERVVQWYFFHLDNNGSHDISKKEMKPFKRFLKKKAKPRKCARKFTDYCDLNKDKAISLQELKGCLGVNKEGTTTSSSSQGTRQGTNLFTALHFPRPPPAGFGLRAPLKCFQTAAEQPSCSSRFKSLLSVSMAAITANQAISMKARRLLSKLQEDRS
ncbi:SPARC-related modular calcium-binding protein 1 isoform X5 [Hemibagrus wyckioides]|uniref:SPARC-related modular calcium-binding protein 1 isoform X5 n=1 Tax=Hemibagrus wyckioides TaxID=337641 RepID=UPI00266B5579|nr:SPARC-related modular calcium-binding protein 1 isoform X5 [Hemibagrus wyckioides]